MRILLVVNAFASSVTARNTVVVHRTLSHGHQVDIVETNRRGHATRFAQDAARRDVDVVVAFGGDGTLNEVATGVAGSSTALGVLPGGSTNVFARTIGMPNDPVAAAGMLAAGLRAGSIGPIGLGRVNGRYFCFHAGVGYDAAVVRTVERRATWKRWIGHPLFMTSALTTWVGYDRKHPHFAVTTPAGTVGDGYFTVVLNTNPYTYLGNRPLDLSPAATLERGLVAVTFRTMSAVRILSSFVGALRGGGMTPSKHLDLQTDLVDLTVEHPEPFAYQVDGDYLGETTRLQFHHVPAAVNLVRPARSHPASGPQDS